MERVELPIAIPMRSVSSLLIFRLICMGLEELYVTKYHDYLRTHNLVDAAS